MKKYFNIFTLLVLFSSLTGCKKDLDINNNPNSATGSTVKPALILPNALTVTAANTITYNTYASFIVGYQLPGRGVSGFSDTYSYNFTSASNNSLWDNVFGNLKDYQYIITSSQNDPQQALFNAIAHIGRVYNYQKLVDAYGDVPYTDALQGAENVAPKFDSATSVYQNLVKELDDAIAKIKSNAGNAGTTVTALNGSSDVLFGGNLTKWIQFANNIKLRILVRAEGSSINNFVSSAYTTFSTEGFLLENALVNPGYNAASKQNPFWSYYHSSVTGSASSAATYYIPSKYIYTFYNGPLLTDAKRGALIYRNFPSTPTGQLGDEKNNPGAIPTYSAWFTGTGTGLAASNTIGVLKGRAFGVPVFLASDIYFLLAEAALNGHILSGDAKSNFDKGILASYQYLETNVSNVIESGQNPSADAKAYQTANAGNYLANYELAGSKEQRLEAIITQKYIASNTINSFEAWSDFRRTTYPKIQANGSATTTFVSISSASSRPDKLPVRDIYPQTEYNLNPNTPQINNAFSSPIFWDLN
ncbi:hypothetical protein TH53_11570 [Pedobacter lusitanus]|uniref:Contig48, whole genome shotgun sequence n=1 Tax=Pedobacter lusitanus TaxID=1503925 RepID=A0A0D0F5V2_9SPHI|nr:SusD/RagB family nutrient-binding outer membrane lipoprotein [Pedobacter lusitanus]KIO77003.1 hypothetical protein TH53_11570 [Pedobacter lusitanus]